MRDLGWICTNSWRFGRSDLPVGGFGEVRGSASPATRRSRANASIPTHVKCWEVVRLVLVGGRLPRHGRSVYRTGPDRTVERPAIGRRTSECQVDCVNLLIPGSRRADRAASPAVALDMPRTDELLTQRARLPARGRDGGDAAGGRASWRASPPTRSTSCCASSSVGPAHRAREHERLRAAARPRRRSRGAALASWCDALRDGTMPLDAPASPSTCARPSSTRSRSTSPSTRGCAPRSSAAPARAAPMATTDPPTGTRSKRHDRDEILESLQRARRAAAPDVEPQSLKRSFQRALSERLSRIRRASASSLAGRRRVFGVAHDGRP